MAKKKKLSNLRLVKIILFASVLSVASYFGYQSLLAPAEINLITERKTEPWLDATTSTLTILPTGCTSWFDGCNTCTVRDGQIESCTRMKCMGETQPPHCLSYSGPITTSVPKPSLTPTPYPTATPSPLSIFKVSEACGPTSFLSITFTCNNQGSSTLADNVCTDFYLAYEKALLACSEPRSQ